MLLFNGNLKFTYYTVLPSLLFEKEILPYYYLGLGLTKKKFKYSQCYFTLTNILNFGNILYPTDV
jgi:hypothetical protein